MTPRVYWHLNEISFRFFFFLRHSGTALLYIMSLCFGNPVFYVAAGKVEPQALCSVGDSWTLKLTFGFSANVSLSPRV